jgi:hypothetical protein
VHVAGCTQHPSDAWVAQQARQLSWSLADRASPPRFLIHDRDPKFSGAFDEVFRSEGIKIIRTPIQAPQANAFAERFVGTVRRECLDWILITGRPSSSASCTPTSIITTAIVRIVAWDSWRHSRALLCASPLPAIRSGSTAGIDSVGSFTSTARPREPDRVYAPHKPGEGGHRGEPVRQHAGLPDDGRGREGGQGHGQPDGGDGDGVELQQAPNGPVRYSVRRARSASEGPGSGS